MKLIPNWKRAWRMLSMHAMGWAATALAAWPVLPEDLKAEIDPAWFLRGVAILLLLGMVARLVVQDKVSGGQP